MSEPVSALLPRLTRALDGDAPVLLGPAAQAVGDQVRGLPGTALVLSTSGSTGNPRAVALGAEALRASARATHRRLRGPGQWLLTLPADHVAGVQVLVRSILAGTAPELTESGPFRPADLAAAIGRMRTDVPRYVSLVPTQLVRVLQADDGGACVAALGTCAAVLVGGAATPPDLLDRARAAGIAVVTTYGMTETCGGCVYDGLPLEGVQVRTSGPSGRIEIAGPVLATAYLSPDGSAPEEPAPDGGSELVEQEGRRWLRTTDSGRLEQGRLSVLGRLDDVLVTGGLNVHPAEVERRLAAAGFGECVVVGVPDETWGQRVTAVVAGPATLAQVRDAVGGGPLAPQAVVSVPDLPRRGPGKPDRRAATALATLAVAEGSAEVHRPRG
ncbi:AMP-binding protein [Ruania suaedae]|uniref:AMP-binding protein n=1 Tax=Ruania suaedae TaxID=2897774 RepID=UPI001E2E1A62|nr:AMP-binding protein [Ruania suaedae]UFU02495.1 AMP-binding protein [Ruania suaedae]